MKIDYTVSDNDVASDCRFWQYKVYADIRGSSLEINQSIMFICIAPNKQKFSEVLAAKQVSFELFSNVSVESDEVCSSTGSLFHVAGPDTAKLRRPMVERGRHTTVG